MLRGRGFRGMDLEDRRSSRPDPIRALSQCDDIGEGLQNLRNAEGNLLASLWECYGWMESCNCKIEALELKRMFYDDPEIARRMKSGTNLIS